MIPYKGEDIVIIVFNGKSRDSHSYNNLINNISIWTKVGSPFPNSEIMVVYEPMAFKEHNMTVFFTSESDEVIFLP